MYVLMLIVMVNTHTSVTTTDFKSSSSCLKAISDILELESKNQDITIKARCVAK